LNQTQTGLNGYHFLPPPPSQFLSQRKSFLDSSYTPSIGSATGTAAGFAPRIPFSYSPPPLPTPSFTLSKLSFASTTTLAVPEIRLGTHFTGQNFRGGLVVKEFSCSFTLSTHKLSDSFDRLKNHQKITKGYSVPTCRSLNDLSFIRVSFRLERPIISERANIFMHCMEALNQKPVIQTSVASASKRQAAQSQAHILAELDIRGLHASPNSKPDFSKLKFGKTTGRDKESTVFAKVVDEAFALKPSTALSLIPNYDQFNSPNTSTPAQLRKAYNALLVERESQVIRLLFDHTYRSSPEGQFALQTTKEKILNRYAAIGGSALGAVYSYFFEPLMALSVADYIVDSDIIYEPEFQAQLGRQGQIAKQQLRDFKSHPIDNSCISVANQWDTFRTLYSEGRGFEAGFGFGSYVGDLAGYALVVKGTVQGTLKFSAVGLKVATPVVAKGVSKTVSTIKEVSVPINEFLAHHTFRSPITLQFDACRLNCGFPIDSIKFRKPFKVRIPVRDRLVFGGPKNPPANGRVYMPQDQQFKHHPNGYGSTNPIRDNKVLQELLDTAYSVPYKEQGYNIYERKLIKFQHSEKGRYHAYEVDPCTRTGVLEQIPEEVLHKMCADGLLTSNQVQRLINNKGI
jgi:hypothetical protein